MMENMEGLGKMVKIRAEYTLTLSGEVTRPWASGRVKDLPTLPGVNRPSLPFRESHQSHRDWPPSRRLLPAAPSAQAMSSARGKGGGGFQTKITQTHTRAPPAQGRKKHTTKAL